MVSVTPKEQLNRLLESLYDEGVLDQQFDQLRRFKDDNPGLIANELTMFCRDLDRLFGFIDRLLEKPVMVLEDYRRILTHVIRLKGCCLSVGGRCVKVYCEEFLTSYMKKDTAGIVLALDRIKQESFRLRTNFQTVIELEKKILADSADSTA